MYFKVENSGCSVRKGRVQIRYSLFLDKTDYGYDKHYVEVPIIPAEGYQGDVDKNGMPTNQTDYGKWWSELPTEMQHNPFHNHFVQVEPDITDVEILYVGEVALIESKRNWDKDEYAGIKNKPLVKIQPYALVEDEQARYDLCIAKVMDIQSKTLEKKDVVDIWAQ